MALMKLRVGGFYRLDDGQVIGPMEYDPGACTSHPYTTAFGCSLFDEDGRHYGATGPDVISEVDKDAMNARRSVLAEVGYEKLAAVLQEAHDQAASGKGAHRHANGQPFEAQPSLAIARDEGSAFLTGQARKKIGEAGRMVNRGDAEAARREYLGAIVYLAARVILLDEQEAGS